MLCKNEGYAMFWWKLNKQNILFIETWKKKNFVMWIFSNIQRKSKWISNDATLQPNKAEQFSRLSQIVQKSFLILKVNNTIIP